MTEGSALEELVHETPNGDGIERPAIAVLIHVLFEILIAIFEDEDQLCFAVNNIMEADDVDVFELLHERDFSDRG